MVRRTRKFRTQGNSNGFIGIAYLLLLVVVIAGIGLAAWKVHDRSSRTGPPGSLKYETKDFGLSLDVTPDKQFDWQVSLTTFFGDSVVSNPCPERIGGFKSDVQVSYDGSDARLSITQNSSPLKRSESQQAVACPAVVVPSFDKKIILDRGWIDSSDSHAITANGESYTLIRDKKAYTLTLSKKDDSKNVVVYPPDKVVFLFSHRDSTYSTCMSQAQLRDYAGQHGLALASTRYQDFEPAFHRSQPHVTDGDYYNPMLLVIANDGLNAVIKEQGKRQPHDACNVWVGTSFNIEQISTAE